MSATSPSPNDPSLRPPTERGTGRAFGLAALFHVLLIALIALGVHWKSHPPPAVEAELWSATPHTAAPKPTAPVVKREPTPQPAPEPPPPPPPPAPAPKPQPQAPSQADIVLQKQREQAAQQKKLEEEQQRLLAQKKAEEAAQRAAEQKRIAQQKAAQEAERKRLEAEREAKLKEQQRLAREKQEAERKRLEKEQAALAASTRAEYMKQLMSQAGTGAANSTGTAAKSSGPSGAYAARIAGLVKQQVIYPEINQISGDPKVIITVRLDPNSGEVLSSTIKRSSGVPSWDQAVLRAIQSVGRFPPDEHGNWYTPMEIKAGPHDPS